MPALPDLQPPSGDPSRPFRLRTDRLLLLPLLGPDGLLDGGDGEDVLLDAVVSVVLSNPAFLATHEGSDGEVGSYDRSRLERDLGVAAMDPLRIPFAVLQPGATTGVAARLGGVVGWGELLVEHPRDHVPWIGLLELHADAHGHGLGREAAQALVGWARELPAPALRLGVDDGNDRAAAFWTACGFVPVDRRERDSPAGRLGVTVMEIATHA
ncbi:MAG TPA: GNAT family N-acetyltransferase [Motilibacteraceae bacterium]|nr:GNAT family N-acetyltransferase [Motilibacteraceae bacterium]